MSEAADIRPECRVESHYTEVEMTCSVATYVCLVVLLIVCALATISLLSGVAAADHTTNNSHVEIVSVEEDDFGSGPQLIVILEAQTTSEVSNFNFTYSSDLNSATGRVHLGDGSGEISDANHSKTGAGFTSGDSIRVGGSDGSRVKFTFAPGSSFTEDSDRYRINVSANGTTYGSADGANRSVYTDNFYSINDVNDHTNSPVSTAVPVQLSNPKSNEIHRAKFLDPGPPRPQVNCRGVGVGATCTDPDTGGDGVIVTKNSRTGQFSELGAPIAFNGFLSAEGNATGRVQPAPGSVTLIADQPTAVRFGDVSNVSGKSALNLDEVTVTNASSGTTIYRETNFGGDNRFPPLFLDRSTQYRISFTDTSGFGTNNRSLVAPTAGLSSLDFRLVDSSDSSAAQTSVLSGQVVNESGTPLEDITVIATPQGSTGATTEIYNSTTTDANGLYSIRVPVTTVSKRPNHALRLVSNRTTGNVPVHYPTIHDNPANDNNGYTVDSSGSILPPVSIRNGGRIDIAVTNSSGGKLPSLAFASLSQVSSAYPTLERTGISNSITQFALGKARIQSGKTSLVSPTTSADKQIGYTVKPLSGQSRICIETPSVSTGSATSSLCVVEPTGTLNLTVEQCSDILAQSRDSIVPVNKVFFVRK